MKLRHITFTGAGDDTSLDEMVSISRDYPTVEWGILLSESSTGVKPRFPSREWLDASSAFLDLTDLAISVSGHLCGKWMRRLISVGATPEAHVGPIWRHFQRVQINLAGSEDFATPFFAQALEGHKQWILQNRSTELVEPILRQFPEKPLQILFDASGGRGVVLNLPPPALDDVLCGYAGGIGPENVVEVLARIAERVGDRDVWIDMESGVRTDDRFDLMKVRDVLSRIGGFL